MLGDGAQAMSLGERECSLQRRFQKLVEIAPSPTLPESLREQITQAALRMARAVRYRSLGTFEFLVDEQSTELPFVFIEANPRLQVEHTVTEEVTGLDLVQLQIAVAAGADAGRAGPRRRAAAPQPQGFAIQWRINAETLDAQGNARPSSGTLARFDLPAGPGVRVDTHGYAGLAPSPHYDTLLAKLIVHSRRRRASPMRVRRVAARAGRVPHRRPGHQPAAAARAGRAARVRQRRRSTPASSKRTWPSCWPRRDGVAHGHARHAPASRAPMPAARTLTTAAVVVRAPMAGAAGAVRRRWRATWCAAGAQLAVLEAMKMEHLLHAPSAGRVRGAARATPGDYLVEGQSCWCWSRSTREAVEAAQDAGRSPTSTPSAPTCSGDRPPRPHARREPRRRPSPSATPQGGRTARENIADLCDWRRPGNFIEYGALADRRPDAPPQRWKT